MTIAATTTTTVGATEAEKTANGVWTEVKRGKRRQTHSLSNSRKFHLRNNVNHYRRSGTRRWGSRNDNKQRKRRNKTTKQHKKKTSIDSTIESAKYALTNSKNHNNNLKCSNDPKRRLWKRTREGGETK